MIILCRVFFSHYFEVKAQLGNKILQHNGKFMEIHFKIKDKRLEVAESSRE